MILNDNYFELLYNSIFHSDSIKLYDYSFVQLSPDDDVEFTGFISLLDKLKENLDQGERLEDFHIHDYLPRDTAGFYRYLGSLTTPDCTEGIVWTIFTNTIPISESQVSNINYSNSNFIENQLLLGK